MADDGGIPVPAGRRAEGDVSAELLRALFAAVPDAILVADDAGRYRDANPAALELFGCDLETLRTLRVSDVVARVDETPAVADSWARFRRGGGRRGTVVLRRADGSEAVAEYRAVNDVLPGRHVSILRDVAGRRTADAHFRLLFEANPQPMWVFDLETLRIVDANPAMVERYGYSEDELRGMTIRDLRPPEEQPVLDEVLASLARDPRPRVTATRHRCKDGRIVDVEVVGRSIEVGGRPCRFVTATDVTDRRRLEEQLLQARKMEAIGRLAGGVAHDFNNLLTAILGYATLAQAQVPAGSPLHDDLAEIEHAATRAARLTQRLLAFSRQQLLRPTPLDPSRVVAEMERMLARIVGEDVAIATTFAEGLVVLADEAQLQQVLLNLVVNARDAMPEGGSLRIETRRRELAADELVELPAGSYVELLVADQGIGMSPEVKAHLFEPFFTTKPVGAGTGLGLSTVYGIVRQSGGTVLVDSAPGDGTAVRVLLPLASKPAALPGTAEEATPASAPGGHEVILLAEDEPQVAELTSRVLRRAGYDVRLARDGAEALAIAAALGPRLALLLTDVVMPGMDGRALAEELTARVPSLPVIYVSGYTGDTVLRHGVDQSRVHFLAKPFGAADLLALVRRALDGAAGAPRPILG